MQQTGDFGERLPIAVLDSREQQRDLVGFGGRHVSPGPVYYAMARFRRKRFDPDFRYLPFTSLEACDTEAGTFDE
jgi:hypothetical protein